MNSLWIIALLCFVEGLHANVLKWSDSRSITPLERIQEERNQHTKQKVFILTLPRSGSTFISELFRQNPEFVYLFEATRGFAEPFEQDSCKEYPEDKNVEHIMRGIFDCNFKPLQQFMYSQQWKGEMYSWERVEYLSSKVSQCVPENTANMTGHERKTNTASVAIKEITMWAPKLNWLEKILGPELHVIWLVRDVRGWVSSWIADPGKNFYVIWGNNHLNFWERYSECELASIKGLMGGNRLERIKELLTNTSYAPHMRMAAWWTIDIAVTYHYFSKFAGNTFLVQYEHLSLYPLDVAQQIFSFLGRKTTNEEVLRWLINATVEGDDSDRYNTIRDSAMMTEIWQNRLTLQQIREIEEIADVWFPFFGYKKWLIS